MRIVVIGGHLTPALCLIEEIGRDEQVFYIGRRNALEGDSAESLEYKEITKRDIPFFNLKTGRLQRSFTRRTIPSIIKIPKGFFEAIRILIKVKPQVVVGFGGYVSLPVGLASYFLRIPLVIHEQTQEAGLSNKFLSRFAVKVCISFETSRKFFPRKKVVLTGNPIRRAFRTPGERFKKKEDLPLILVTGGSLGSHAINSLVKESLNKLLDKYILVHQTGASMEFNDFDELTKKRESLTDEKKDRYILQKFLNDVKMGSIMKTSDLIIGRAGINTVSEIITLRKKALLIPLPYSQRDEQLKNAMLVKKLGLGEVAEQGKLDAKTFLDSIDSIIQKKVMIEKFKGYNFPRNSARKLAEVVYAAAKKSY